MLDNLFLGVATAEHNLYTVCQCFNYCSISRYAFLFLFLGQILLTSRELLVFPTIFIIWEPHGASVVGALALQQKDHIVQAQAVTDLLSGWTYMVPGWSCSLTQP